MEPQQLFEGNSPEFDFLGAVKAGFPSPAESIREERPAKQYGSAIRASLDEKLKESVISVMPVSLLVFALSVTPWVDITGHELFVFIVAAFLLVLGIGLFNLGADMAMTPMGQYIGQGLTASKKMGILLGVGFAMGLLITIAEPDLSVLAGQVKAVMNGTLLIATVGVGVGLLLLIGIVKIVFHMDRELQRSSAPAQDSQNITLRWWPMTVSSYRTAFPTRR